ncbi:MAG: GMC family oxidoreductase, partial [Calditrichaeota bacterium]|nr:GMC family oxidoreductase [Calditrichota bacterium]
MRNNSGSHIRHFDAIIIGSGFGGSMLASVLVNAGQNVLMLERGDWVKRGAHNWAMNASVDLTPHYSFDTPMRVREGGNKDIMGNYACVGGPSVFYGGVSFRFREKDFEPPPEIVGDSGAEWPITYADLEPYYSRAEQMLDVAGADSADPSAPPRSAPFPQNPDRLSTISEKVKSSAESLGLSPFP